jgi:hypothetical protein
MVPLNIDSDRRPGKAVMCYFADARKGGEPVTS